MFTFVFVAMVTYSLNKTDIKIRISVMYYNIIICNNFSIGKCLILENYFIFFIVKREVWKNINFEKKNKKHFHYYYALSFHFTGSNENIKINVQPSS